MLTENKVKLLLAKAFSLKSQADSLMAEYNKVRNQIYDYLDQSKMKSIEGHELSESGAKKGLLVATKVDRVTSLTYDIPKLKRKLDKELFNEIVDKTFTITDIDAMISLLKKAGVKPSEFKKLITVSEKVNNARIQQAYSVGDISLNDIKDAYEVKVSKSLQIRKMGEKD